MKRIEYPKMVKAGGAETLAHNQVWNIPDGADNVHGDLKTHGMWQLPVSYRAMAHDADGYVYGVRTLTDVRQSGYALEGRVSVDGKKSRVPVKFRREMERAGVCS